MTKESKIKKLESDLEILKRYNSVIFETYGSELCAGDMIKKEEELENKIKKLKENIK